MVDPASAERGGLLRRLLPLGALLVTLVGLMLFLAGTLRDKIAPAELLPDPGALASGQTAPVRSRAYPDVIEQVGTVRSRYRVAVASKLLAEVVELHVEPGERVEGGAGVASATLVAVLDARDPLAQRASAAAQVRAAEEQLKAQRAQVEASQATRDAVRARFRQAESDFVRVQSLVRSGAATQEALDRAVAARDVAQADLTAAASQITAAQRQLAQVREQLAVAKRQLESADVLLSYTRLVAPLSGIVTEKQVEVGDTVSPGQTLVRLQDPRALELHAAVAESLAARLRIGHELAVWIDALERELKGAVREIAPEADPASRTVTVKVTLPQTSGLTSGLFGRLRIPIGQTQALVIPQAAVRQVGQLDLVEVVDASGRARRRFVTLGRARPPEVEVRSGLAEGDQVLLRD